MDAISNVLPAASQRTAGFVEEATSVMGSLTSIKKDVVDIATPNC
jgi:hypothetical protein